MNSVFEAVAGGTALLLASVAAGTAADMQTQTFPVKAAAVVQSGAANPILYVNNQISLDAIAQHIDYLATGRYAPQSPIGPTNSERGWQPGLQLTGSAMFDLGPLSNVYIMGQFSWAKGNSAYSGALIPTLANVAKGKIPAYGSLVRTSEAETKDFDFRLGKGFEVSQDWMLTPFVGFGYHVWDRGTNPFREYENGYAGGGMMIQWAPTRQWVISANGLVGSTLGPRVSTPDNPEYSPTTLNLGSKLMWKAGLSADYALTQQWHANAGLDYTRIDYGASSEARSKAGYEPVPDRDSRSDIWAVKAGVGYSFYQPNARY